MKTRKIITWLISIPIIGFIGYYVIQVIMLFAVFFNMESSSKLELLNNYSQRESELTEVAEFVNKITPDSLKLYLEFKDDISIDLWVWSEPTGTQFPRKYIFQQWDINPYEYVAVPSARDSLDFAPLTNSLDTVLQLLNWNSSTFKNIKKKLDSANCISVNNGWPSKVGFARSGMGKYSYNIFRDSLSEIEIPQWNDSCQYIYYNPTTVLEYGGGAIGPYCFPD